MEKTRQEGIRRAIAELNAAGDVAIVAHKGPDGDAIGSSLALASALRAVGKRVRVYARREDVGAPSVLDGMDSLSPPEAAATDPKPDLLVCLDCATVARIAVPHFRDGIASFRTLVIDHHESNPRYGTVNFVVDDASSTSELVFDILKAAGWPVSREAAEALWVGITTDTGRFSYSSTHPSTLECGAELLRLGVRQWHLNDEVFCKASLAATRLRALAYASLEMWCDGAVATIRLDADAYESLGCAKSDSEDFVDIPRAVRGAAMAVFFYRSFSAEPVTHVSLRSCDGRVDACAFASIFGGGGHRAAAGATLDCGLAEAERRVREALSGFPGISPATGDGGEVSPGSAVNRDFVSPSPSRRDAGTPCR